MPGFEKYADNPLIMYYVFAVIVAYPVSRIFRRAGFPAYEAVALVLPVLGFLACAALLSLRPWPALEAVRRERGVV
ncbi:MAG: hypothetical protein OXT65_10580 [Alphaproteobacteria bacterium]|nr:hypothetical protein [Alphaproteobacteria bacterium]